MMWGRGSIVNNIMKYVGDFEANSFHGYGVETYIGGPLKGQVYKGEWNHSKREGMRLHVSEVSRSFGKKAEQSKR